MFFNRKPKEPSVPENIARFVMRDMVENEQNWTTAVSGSRATIKNRDSHIVIHGYYSSDIIMIEIAGVGNFQREIPGKVRKQLTKACMAFKAYKGLSQAMKPMPLVFKEEI
jgi:hypothetical protein